MTAKLTSLVLLLAMCYHQWHLSSACVVPAVFSAVRIFNGGGAGYAQVPFDAVLADTASGFDTSKTYYTANSTGLYLMHFSIEVPVRTQLNYALQNTSSTPNLLVTHQAYEYPIVTARDDIQYITEGQRIYLSSQYNLLSDDGRQTSWSGFNLAQAMNTMIAFRAALTSNVEDVNNETGAALILDKLIVNAGQAWDLCTDQFRAPKAGVYFLSWTAAIVPNTQYTIELLINGIKQAASMLRETSANGVDTASQSILLTLNAGDTASLFVYGPLYSNANYQTSFTGFLYEPLHGLNVAWTFTFAGVSTSIQGPTYLNFTNIVLNNGAVWNAPTASTRIPISGFYYVKLSAMAPENFKFKLVLQVGITNLISVEDENFANDTRQALRSRALIIHLTAGTELVVNLLSGYNVFSGSSADKFVTFCGFLVQPSDTFPISRRIDNLDLSIPRDYSVSVAKPRASCAEVEATVFSVHRISNTPLAANPLEYEVTNVDTKQGFNGARSVYTVPTDGYYMMHMSAGIPAYEALRYTLRGAPTSPNSLMTISKYNGEVVTSRDDLQYITQGTQLYMSSDYPLYSDSMKQTSWSGFKLDDTMSPLVLFRVARQSNFAGNDVTVPMDRLLVNVGQSWDRCGMQLIMPVDGIYFLSWSSASPPNAQHDLRLLVNGNTVARSYLGGPGSNGTDSTSHSVLLNLFVNDTVQLYQSGSGSLYSDVNYQTSFMGFLYKPFYAPSPIAWCVAVRGDEDIAGPVTRIDFTNVLLNEGETINTAPWNRTTLAVNIRVAGTYYLSISSGAKPALNKMNVILMTNGTQLMNVMEKVEGKTGNGRDLRSRSLIVRLQQYDELYVSIPTGYYASSFQNDLMFSGFLIYSTLP